MCSGIRRIATPLQRGGERRSGLGAGCGAGRRRLNDDGLLFHDVKINDFQKILAAEVVSNFGSMLSALMIPWLAALVLGATPFQMGTLLVADVVAGASGSLLLGAVVDRARKRSVMVAADLARALLVGLLVWLAAAHQLQLWILVLAAAFRGWLTVMFELSRSAWMAQQLDAGTLSAGNARVAAGGSIAETLAFALGGWLYQWLGIVTALAIDAASYAVSALFMRGVREEAPPAHLYAHARLSLRTLAADARSGIREVMARPELKALAGVEILVSLAMSLAGTSYMIYVSRNLGFDTGVLGLIFATGGVGAIAGAALAARLEQRVARGRAIRIGLLLASAGALCIPLAAGPTIVGAGLLVLHQIVGDGGQTVYQVHDRTLRQTLVTPDLLARVDGGIRTLGQLATLIGALGGGALATAFGARSTLAAAALLLACAALAARALREPSGMEVRSVPEAH
ncbi:MAG: MFS transporter [Bacteroidetes bacterium]|nr:MFS transporter [Bacteroidota bacterium]